MSVIRMLVKSLPSGSAFDIVKTRWSALKWGGGRLAATNLQMTEFPPRLLAWAALAVVASGCAQMPFGRSLDKPDAAGETPLTRAAAADDAAAIRSLIARGADPNYQGRKVVSYSLLFPFKNESWEDLTRDSLTPLMVAAERGHEAAVAALIEAGARPDEAARFGAPGRTALRIAAKAGRTAIVRRLVVRAGPGPAADMAVFDALREGHGETARVLVAAGLGVTAMALIEAAEHGDRDSVAMLLAAGLGTDHVAAGKALVRAAAGGHVHVLRALLDAGAPADAKGLPVGFTPLGLAAREGHAEAVRVLLEAGAGVDTVMTSPAGADGDTALGLAARGGHAQVVRLLLGAGADPRHRDGRGLTPLARASEAGQQEIVDLLRGAGARPAEALGLPLLAAARDRRLDEVRRLMAAGASLDVRDSHSSRTPLMLAALAGHRELVKQLLRGHPDLALADAGGQTALALAIVMRHLEIAGDIVAAGAPVSDADVTLATRFGLTQLVPRLLEAGGAAAAGGEALAAAAQKNDVATLRLLLARRPAAAALARGLFAAAHAAQAEATATLLAAGADANARLDGATPLIAAAAGGEAEVVRRLLAAGADPAAGFDGQRLGGIWRYPFKETGWTALHLAAARGQVEAARALVAGGAPLAPTASRGNTPLRCAILRGHEEIEAILRAAGARDPMTVGGYALVQAAGKGDLPRVQELLAAGIAVDSPDEFGHTPLIAAAMYNRPAVVRALLAARADVNARTRSGTTALSAAASMGHAEVVQLLSAAGAR